MTKYGVYWLSILRRHEVGKWIQVFLTRKGETVDTTCARGLGWGSPLGKVFWWDRPVFGVLGPPTDCRCAYIILPWLTTWFVSVWTFRKLPALESWVAIVIPFVGPVLVWHSLPLQRCVFIRTLPSEHFLWAWVSRNGGWIVNMVWSLRLMAVKKQSIPHFPRFLLSVHCSCHPCSRRLYHYKQQVPA